MRRVYFSSSITISFLILLFSGCKKENDSKPINYYFKGTINNVTADLVVEDQENRDIYALAFETGNRMPNEWPPVSFFIEKALGSSIIDNTPGASSILRVYIVKKLPDGATLDDRKTVIQVGTYPFGKHGQNSFGIIEEGGIVWYTDKNGVDWYSERGVNNSPADSFEVVERRDWTEDNALILWKAKINCNLYNGSGASIRINGEFRAQTLNP
jgi:hypothetical protein